MKATVAKSLNVSVSVLALGINISTTHSYIEHCLFLRLIHISSAVSGHGAVFTKCFLSIFSDQELGLRVVNDNKTVAQSSTVIVLAVKPYMMADVIDEIASDVTKDKVVVSVAAGVFLADMESVSGPRVLLSCVSIPIAWSVGVDRVYYCHVY